MHVLTVFGPIAEFIYELGRLTAVVIAAAECEFLIAELPTTRRDADAGTREAGAVYRDAAARLRELGTAVDRESDQRHGLQPPPPCR